MRIPFLTRRNRPADEDATIAINRLADDIVLLTGRREDAISSFRQTANELASVNEQLDARNSFYESVINTIMDQKKQAEQMKADNTHVRSKILEIIGEED